MVIFAFGLPEFRRPRPLRSHLVIVVALLLITSFGHGGQTTPAQPVPHFRNTAPGVHYVGSKICAGCHYQIYRDFSRTEMGNSMFLPGRLAELGWLTQPVDFVNQHHNRHYQIFSRGSKVFESEYQLDSNGNEIFRHTEELAYVIGTGANGATPIVQRGDYLFQAPISYYSGTKSWDLSPNYEVRDLGFGLPVTSDCVGCHSGRTQPVRDTENKYQNPAVLEPAIGCERCHGPGELHLAERQMGKPVPSGADTSIVNPAKLPFWLADNICMNCHEGDIRSFQPGKSWDDFRPGTPLNDTVTILKAPIDPKATQSPLLEHYYSMTLSRCYRGSGGKLGCQSCHDPHVEPSAEAAPEYFRGRCLQCHTERSCTLDLQKRLAAEPLDACTNCHMAKRPALTVSHSTLTDHRILRAADEPYPKSAFAESLPGTGLIHINAIPGKPDSVPPVALLRAYRNQIVRSRLEYKDYYFVSLDRLIKAGSQDAFVLSAIAQKAASDGDMPKAVRFARQALEHGPASENDYELLSTFLARAGDSAGSIRALKQGLAIAPYSDGLYEDLTERELASNHNDEAAATLQRGLELFPEDAVLREAAQQISARQHFEKGIAQFRQRNFPAALDELRVAAQADPNNAEAHDYIGVILGESGKLEEAEAEFQQAAKLDPAFPDPHFHLGLAHLKAGSTDAAISEYQEALLLNPRMVEAQYGLSEICGKLGDADGAIRLLRQVTQAEPDFAEAHYNLGLNLWNRYKTSNGLRQKGELDEAAQELRKATELEPTQPGAFLALGELLADKGDLGPSVESLQKALALQPANAELHYNLGLCLRLKGDLNAAAAEFRATLKFAPQYALAHRSLGLVLRESGDLEAAATELRLAVAELPDDPQGHHLLGTVLLRQNDLQGAIAELRKAVELNPNLAEARASLSQALRKAGRNDNSQQEAAALKQINAATSGQGQAMILIETAAQNTKGKEFSAAVSNLQQAVALSPNLVEAQYQLGVALRQSGDLQKSEEALRRVLQLDPNHAQAHLELGLVLAQRGDSAQGASELRRAVQLAPSLTQAHTALGKLAESSKDWATAIREYQAAAAWNPQDRQTHIDLARSLKASGHVQEAAREMQLAEKLGSHPAR